MKSKKSKFELEIHLPFSTFTEGRPAPVPYIIDGLLPRAAFSVLGAKPKHGKSSMSRIEAVSVAKGISFLERPTEQGEVLLCSLEDPRQHVDNCLKVLGYNPDQDARIHIVNKLARSVNQTVDALATALARMRDIKLVILDTLAKVLRAKDIQNYSEMLELCEQLHLLARESGVHLQALTHCKKVQPEDPFDGFLGSVEIRGETDTNIVLYDDRKKRFIQSETRIGTAWESTELNAELETIGKAQMVKRFYLGESLAKTVADQTAAREKNTKATIKSRIVLTLKSRGGKAPMMEVLNGISGNEALKYDMRDELVKEGVIKITGVAHSKTNPLHLNLLQPEWSSSGIAVTQPTQSEALPAIEYVCCAYGDCTNSVPEKGQYCASHRGVTCVN
jgi:hypothetical protein